ncbi:MAG: DUF4340 domain-containing protein [Bacteriovoracaceae bacterium]
MTKRHKFSTWATGLLIISILSLVGFNQIFHRDSGSNESSEVFSSIFSKESFGDIQNISFKNRLSEIQFEKDEKSNWMMISPRKVKAKVEILDRIFQGLEEIKVIRVYEKDPINLSNFSLEEPNLVIQLSNKEKSMTFKFGLVNPIDNSTYLTLEEDKVIYQIHSLGSRIETFGLASFIDAKIFSLEPEKLKSLAIYRGKSSSAQLKLTQQKSGWKSSTGRVVAANPVHQYIETLNKLSSSHIIDNISETQMKSFQEYLKRPSYKIEFVDKNNKKLQYVISLPLKSLPDLKIKYRQNVLVKASHLKYFYLFPKEALSNFQKTQYSFKKLSIKKIFY